jgi:hypothetical protein
MLRLRIEHYRAKAAEAEESARLAKDPQVRMAYLRAAKSWTRPAEQAEADAEDAVGRLS